MTKIDESREAECRAAFEKWITAPPFEHSIARHGPDSGWTGNYRSYDVQLAWCAWQDSTARAGHGGAVNLPDDPTKEMVDAAMAVNWADEDVCGSVINMWHAMMAKAPVPASAAEKSEPLTDSYVQTVPDKCDRIVWRKNYYHLPLTSTTAAPRGADTCTWTREDDVHMPDTWDGSCGAKWTFTNDGPVENDMKFCPQCGGAVKISGQGG
jgi:hypothetical protein